MHRIPGIRRSVTPVGAWQIQNFPWLIDLWVCRFKDQAGGGDFLAVQLHLAFCLLFGARAARQTGETEAGDSSVNGNEGGGHQHDCGHDHDHDHDHDHQAEAFDRASVQTNADLSVYQGHGVQFEYPEHWEIQEETGADQTTISVQSPGTTYWTLSLFEDRPDADQVAESVIAAYEEMYEELDIYEPDVQVLGVPAIARELDFVCLDLVSTASLIVFQSLNHTILITFQGEDRELEKTRPLVELMTRSLLCDLEE